MKYKKDKAIQIRITIEESKMIDELRKIDPEFNLSKVFRDSLRKQYENKDLVGIGSFQIK